MASEQPAGGRQELRTLPRVVSAYAVSGAVVSLALATVDFCARGPGQWRWLAQACGLGLFSGLVSGAIAALVLYLVGLLRSWALRVVVSCLFAGGWVFVAMTELGVMARLSGPYATLAWAALLGICALAVAGVLAALSLAPDPRADAGSEALFGAWLAHKPTLRRAGGALLIVGVLGAVTADVTLFADQYPFIHETLRRVARLCALSAPLVLGLSQRWLTILVVAASPTIPIALFTLDEARSAVVSAMRAAPFVELAIDDVRALADSDLDGFPAWLGGGDCAPFDPAVHPNAQEIPGNSIDDNCRLGDLPVAARWPTKALHPPASGAQAASLVLITIDTLRADHLSAYGYARKTSPNIDAFFASGRRYTDAMASGAFTTISVPSLLRGLLPRRLNWAVARQTSHFRLFPAAAQPALLPEESWLNAHLLCLDVEHAPLAMLLGPLGFHTWAVVDDGGSAFLSRPLVGQGFERFEYIPGESRMLWDPHGDAKTARRALHVLSERDEKPFFLWVHFYGVHAPDAVNEAVPTFGDDVVARYDHEIANVDQELAPLFALLSQIEKERPLVTALTADHGERFSAQGRAHGSNLVEDEIHVPLFLRGAGVHGGVEKSVVSLVDVVPTLLLRAGVSDGPGFDGVDLLSPKALLKRRAVLVDVWAYDAAGRSEFERVGAVSQDFRLVFEPATNSRRLYTRGVRGKLVLERDAELEQAAAEYLERTGPRPLSLLP